MDPVLPQTSPRRPWMGAVSLLLALALVLLAVSAGFGSRWGLWSYRTGFTLLEWAAKGAVGLLLLLVPLLIFTRPGTGRRGFSLALLAALLALPIFLVPWRWQRAVADVPRIHDITTDLENPPPFVDLVPLRAGASNPLEHPGAEVAAEQRAAYPDIRPIVLDTPLEASFERVLEVVRELGWTIVGTDPASGRLEATDQTFWFGFRDDVVIRLTPTDGRTLVDVRSKSRVGRSDVGTNARRIRTFLARLES